MERQLQGTQEVAGGVVGGAAVGEERSRLVLSVGDERKRWRAARLSSRLPRFGEFRRFVSEQEGMMASCSKAFRNETQGYLFNLDAC